MSAGEGSGSAMEAGAGAGAERGKGEGEGKGEGSEQRRDMFVTVLERKRLKKRGEKNKLKCEKIL